MRRRGTAERLIFLQKTALTHLKLELSSLQLKVNLAVAAIAFLAEVLELFQERVEQHRVRLRRYHSCGCMSIQQRGP